MMNYGNILIDVEGEDEDKVKHSIEMTIDEFIIMELCRDEIDFEDPIHQLIAVDNDYTRKFQTSTCTPTQLFCATSKSGHQYFCDQ